MRIFQVITVSEYGGAQSIVANLIQSLSPEHEVFVLYGGEGEAWESLGDNFTRIRLSKHRKSISLYDIVIFFKLIYYKIKYNPDIIHLHSSKMGILGRIAFKTRKTIYTLHGFDSVRKHFRQFLVLEKFLSSSAAKIVAVSQYDVEALKEENITDNVLRIYNGVADCTHSKAALNETMLGRLTAIKNKFPKVIMCIARVSAQKRFDIFIDVAKKLPQHAFVWIGNKEKMLNLPQNAFCLGEIGSANLYLQYADIFILPSNYEGLPMSLLEAMSFGKPIVASSVGGIPEVLDKENGFAISNDVDTFVSKIDYILSDKDIYSNMAKKSREVYLANHTTGKMVNEYLNLFNSLATKRK